MTRRHPDRSDELSPEELAQYLLDNKELEGFIFTRDMEEGDADPRARSFKNDRAPGKDTFQILHLQSILMRLGFLSGGYNSGHFESDTKLALLYFQNQYLPNLSEGERGRFGPETRHYMNGLLVHYQYHRSQQIPQKPEKKEPGFIRRTISGIRRRVGRALWANKGRVLAAGVALGALHTDAGRDVVDYGLMTVDDLRQRYEPRDTNFSAYVEVDGEMRERRPDKLELPPGISDMGAILYTSVPNFDPMLMISHDSLLDNETVAHYLLEDKLLPLGVEESIPYQGRTERAYALTIPSSETGELLSNDGKGSNAMDSVTWPEVLNRITKAPESTDEEVIQYLFWWYKRTYGIYLDKNAITIERFNDRRIKNIRYTGGNAEKPLPFQQLVILDRVASTGSQPNRTTKKVAKPMVDTRDNASSKDKNRLLIWTGIGQHLLVPESFLKQEGTITIEIVDRKGTSYGNIEFTWHELAESVRTYVINRDRRGTFTYRDPNGRTSLRHETEAYVTPDDPIVERIVEKVLKGAKGDCERLRRLRLITQGAEYGWEAGTDVNRPAVFTLMQGWGDCNNLSVAQASLYVAGGYTTGLAYVDYDPSKAKRGDDPNFTFYGHLLTAVEESHLQGCGLRYSTYSADGHTWVLSEPQAGREFGERNGWESQLSVVAIRTIE